MARSRAHPDTVRDYCGRFDVRLRDSNDLGDFLEIGCTTFNIRQTSAMWGTTTLI
jgi:hypothetical protein